MRLFRMVYMMQFVNEIDTLAHSSPSPAVFALSRGRRNKSGEAVPVDSSRVVWVVV